MNMLGYDIRILGNRRFDNGMKELAKRYKDVKAHRLSANYDFSGTENQGMFDPYVIKKAGGKRIGFIGINVDPESLISKENIEGVKFKDVIKTANETAAFLKDKKKCDLVVVVSHIGAVKENDKATDYDLAKASRDIDIIIGGHSHTVIEPGNKGKYPSVVENAAGRPVLIARTGNTAKARLHKNRPRRAEEDNPGAIRLRAYRHHRPLPGGQTRQEHQRLHRPLQTYG